ncbi:restriction endonuclease [Nocardiopsis ganjiahuensis]|uniref:restriction endonuclease n=1 Tax=Nocardiopsis ganjiahuensis TaxID=239984 RepID=UPI0003449E13|nr:restriction endonuclease [Nocardiopsis ganjiahuensis]
MKDTSSPTNDRTNIGVHTGRWLWAHRYALVLASVIALMLGAWIAQSAEPPGVWLAGALVVAAALWWARGYVRLSRQRRALELVDLSEVDLMPGTEFEEHVAGLMRVHGYTAVTVVGGADDGGADVVGRSPDGHPVVVQCKRWAVPVPPNEVRAFIGVLHSGYEGYEGLFVSSNGFTEAAAQEGSPHMVLVDREGLRRWMAGIEAPEPPRGRSR